MSHILTNSHPERLGRCQCLQVIQICSIWESNLGTWLSNPNNHLAIAPNEPSNNIQTNKKLCENTSWRILCYFYIRSKKYLQGTSGHHTKQIIYSIFSKLDIYVNTNQTKCTLTKIESSFSFSPTLYYIGLGN